MRQRVIESVVTAAVLATFAAAVQTYVEVRALRHDVDRLEDIISNVIEDMVVPPPRK